MMDASHAAVRLCGEVAGRDEVLCPGPGHSLRDRSLSVRFDPRAPEGFVVNSLSWDDWRDCRDHVRRALILGRWQPAPRCATPRRVRITGTTTTADALALWERS